MKNERGKFAKEMDLLWLVEGMDVSYFLINYIFHELVRRVQRRRQFPISHHKQQQQTIVNSRGWHNANAQWQVFSIKF
jgi:hypothetical protein